MVQTSNTLILASCLDANFATITPVGRTVVLWNSQGSNQSATITIIGMASRAAYLDGTLVTSANSGGNLTVSVSFTANQVRSLRIL